MSINSSMTRLGDFLTLDKFLKPLATMNLPKSPTFNFCKGVKIYHVSGEIILGNFYRHLEYFSGHTVGTEHYGKLVQPTNLI